MTKIINIKKSWRITLIVEPKDCPERYRKWRPVRAGWFCKKTSKRCSKNQCLYKTEALNDRYYIAQ